MALEALGDRDRARQLLADVQHLRTEDGAYFTGYVFPTGPDEAGVNWPHEHTTYTAAAVVLALDALTDTTPGADIMRGTTLPDLPEVGLECGCGPEGASGPERVAGVSGRTS